MEAGQDNSPKSFPIPLQEKALANGMLHSKLDAVSTFKLTPQGRIHSIDFDSKDYASLVEKFKNDPKDCLAIARENLFSIRKDPRLSAQERNDRLSRYLDAYFKLQIKLDHGAFPPNNKVFKGIPSYVPDGLSDMGADPSVEPDTRTREKLRVNKEQIFEQCKDLFMTVFSYDFSDIPEQERQERMKMFIARKTSLYIYKKLQYDAKNEAFPARFNSIPLARYGEKRLAICRQQALYTQVLLQTFGLTSRLMKTDVSFDTGYPGPHANNLVRINHKWFVLDATNPEKLNSQLQSTVFIKQIPERDMDLNNKTYKWSFDTPYDVRSYATRNNMYYRIMNNVKNPLSR